MASIDQYIDAAVPLMKARAARFDDAGRLPMDEWVERDGPTACTKNLLYRASTNLGNAKTDYVTLPIRHLVRQDLLDTMNLCALALSLLPEDEDAEGGEDG